MIRYILDFFKKKYEEEGNTIRYVFLDKEVITILAAYVLKERKIINTELYDIDRIIVNAGSMGNSGYIEFKIKTKDSNPPIPPNDEDKEAIIINPQRASG